MRIQNYEAAVTEFETALHLAEVIGDEVLHTKAEIATGLATANYLMKQSDRCLELLNQAEAIYLHQAPLTDLKDRRELATIFGLKGELYFDRRRWDLADASFANKLREEILSGNLRDLEIPVTVFKLGQVAGLEGDRERQLALYRRSTRMIRRNLAVYQENPDKLGLIRSILEMCLTVFRNHDLAAEAETVTTMLAQTASGLAQK